MPEGTISAPELDYTFGAGNAGIGKAELLGALLHTGNESNYRKLLLGRGWGQEDEFGNLEDTQFKAFVKRMQDEGILTKADYDFLQAVWDLNEEIKPIAQGALRAVRVLLHGDPGKRGGHAVWHLSRRVRAGGNRQVHGG